jgi:hypothetical protein
MAGTDELVSFAIGRRDGTDIEISRPGTAGRNPGEAGALPVARDGANRNPGLRIPVVSQGRVETGIPDYAIER